jgi:hypothetical protein
MFQSIHRFKSSKQLYNKINEKLCWLTVDNQCNQNGGKENSCSDDVLHFDFDLFQSLQS